MKWLFLVHQVKTTNSRERVKVWRLIRTVGAVSFRNSVYVLPFNKERLEDFQWLCQQIRDAKAEASVFVAESRDANEDKALRMLFVRKSEAVYTALLSRHERLLERIGRAKSEAHLLERLLKPLTKEAREIAEEFGEAERLAFFGAPSEERARVAIHKVTTAITMIQPPAQPDTPPRRRDPCAFHGKTWATREDIHIDRLCSAWLIRRFIDPKARFVFAHESKLPKQAILFDVFGAEFSHHGNNCTFETLVKVFQLKDVAIAALAEMVHDIDLKDDKFKRAEAAGLDLVVCALVATLGHDRERLEAGMVVLDAIYKHLASEKRRGRKS